MKLTEVKWEEKPGNGYLLRELFELLVCERDLTDQDAPSTMPVETVADKEGGEA